MSENDDDDARQAPPEFVDEEKKDDDSMFVSVMSPVDVDVPLSGADEDEDNVDDENPFGAPELRVKTPTTTTAVIESAVEPEEDVFNTTAVTQTTTVPLDDDDTELFGAVEPEPKPASAPVKEVLPETPVTPIQLAAAVPVPVPVPSSPSTPIRPSIPFESQVSTPPTKSILSDTVTSSQPVQKRSTVHDIEITVSDPTKVGDVSVDLLRRSRHTR